MSRDMIIPIGDIVEWCKQHPDFLLRFEYEKLDKFQPRRCMVIAMSEGSEDDMARKYIICDWTWEGVWKKLNEHSLKD